MILFIFAFFLGTQSLVLFNPLPDIYLTILLSLCIVVLSMFFAKRNRKIFIFLLAFVLGFDRAYVHAENILSWTLPNNLINQSVLVKGEIQSIDKKNSFETSFDFKINEFQNNKVNTIVRLTWINKEVPIKVGDRWQFSVRLKPPYGLHNPQSFDFEYQSFEQGVRATGYVDQRQQPLFLGHTQHYFLNEVREYIHQQIQNAIPDNSIAGFVSALTVGFKNDFTQSDWQIFQATGTNHIVAIAGLHIGMLTAMMYFLLQKLFSRFSWIILRVPACKAAQMGSFFTACIYAALAGLSLPVQRALLMLAALVLTDLTNRSLPLWNRLIIALGVIVCVDPMAPGSASFWLSFATVAGIIYVMGYRLTIFNHKNPVHFFKLQGLISILVLPLTLWFFQEISICSLLANAVAIPWIGFLIIPLCLFTTIVLIFSASFAQVLFKLIGILAKPVWYWLSFLSHASWSAYHQGVNNWWQLMGLLFAVILLLTPKGFPGRWIGIIGFLPLILFKPHLNSGDIHFTMLDVGQGLASVIQTKNHVLIFDTGAKSPTGFDAGEQILIPYLRFQKISQIDALIVSHGDNDHIGGSFSLLKSIPVKQILTSVPDRFPTVQAQTCTQGQSWNWDGVDFQILYPFPNFTYEGNNSSCVLRVSNGKQTLLLTGDIEKTAEDSLWKLNPFLLKADILQVPHHGSKTSSTQLFLDAVKPHWALFSLGFFNRYHFPASTVVQRYEAEGVQVLRTDRDGALQFWLRKDQAIMAITHVIRYYWQQPWVDKTG